MKTVFKSSDVEACELEDASEAEAEVLACRHSDGVKKEEGVVVGGLRLEEEDGLGGDRWRALDDT